MYHGLLPLKVEDPWFRRTDLFPMGHPGSNVRRSLGPDHWDRRSRDGPLEPSSHCKRREESAGDEVTKPSKHVDVELYTHNVFYQCMYIHVDSVIVVIIK